MLDALRACAAFPAPSGLESLEHPSTHVVVICNGPVSQFAITPQSLEIFPGRGGSSRLESFFGPANSDQEVSAGTFIQTLGLLLRAAQIDFPRVLSRQSSAAECQALSGKHTGTGGHYEHVGFSTENSWEGTSFSCICDKESRLHGLEPRLHPHREGAAAEARTPPIQLTCCLETCMPIRNPSSMGRNLCPLEFGKSRTAHTIRQCKPAPRLFPSLGLAPETRRQTQPASFEVVLSEVFVVFPPPLAQAIVSFVGYQRPKKSSLSPA